MSNETRVIFRIDRFGKDKEVTAVLPDIPASAGNMTCYAHVGQHGECSRGWYNNKTRPATPAQYAALLGELRGIYESEPDTCTLLVRSRINAKGKSL